MEQNNTKKVQHWYLHIDLDAFFASVEQLDNPSYRGKPVIVGGRKDDKRGVVSTASYEARKYGVHSAMPTFKAVILCPDGIFVRARMSRYAELSYRIMNIFREYSPDVDQMSIDEAFIDLTGTEQLFGPPEQTAKKIKEQVKRETGLTVSVGLASTKYLAKIASGYSKPDGFYFVHPGQEVDFMLNLPLKKVWGIGPKGLEKLNNAGIETTREIYEKPLDLLEFILGPTMGKFLYNVVRGQENESFNRVAKSHSISAENTYHIDLTDIYTAETALLELAHGVMFRLLKEEKFSRTVAVKIKYDDFSTVSIQRTCDRNILTLDTFFDVIKELFEEKYEVGRGIRLLGVGFDKVEDIDRPYQQSLFEDDEKEKKQAVEKAILDLNKKHPGIKIHKARLLKMIIIGFLSLVIPLTQNKVFAQENNITLPPPLPLPSIPEEAPSSFYQWDINDKNKVSFNVGGFWKGDMEGNLASSFGKDYPFAFTASLPVFKQDIELSSLFTLNDMWYFEANFADNFNNNTLTVGFKGTNYLREAKLSNRNITMPNIYSSSYFGYSLSGGNNQSPGISAHWLSPSNKWSSDLLVRYDMTQPKTEIFNGMNKVSKRLISPSSFAYGHSFTFPLSAKNDLCSISNVFVEDEKGSFIDQNGIQYKKLSTSEYLYSESENVLYFSSSANTSKHDGKIPSVLITFNNDSSVDNIIKFTKEESFMGDIEKVFSNIPLEEYKYPLEALIDGVKALKIQANEGFSPYLICDTYELSNSKNASLSVILKTSEELLPSYYAEIKDNNKIGVNEDFFNKKKTYGKVINKNETYKRYPFADVAPEIYINNSSFTDIAISETTCTPVTQISISKKASSGTIQVYKNGVYDSNFIYDSNTGVITFLSDVSNTDIIKVMYQEEASNYAKGVFSLGMGFNLNILPNLVWDISLTSQLPLILKDSYSTVNNLQTGFVALTTGIDFNANGFSVNDKLALSIQKVNASDTLLVSSQSDNTKTVYNADESSANLINENININGITLSKEDNVTNKDIKGIEDKAIKGYKIPLSYDFDTKHPSWAGLNIKLNKGDQLKNSSSFRFYLQIPQDTDLSNLQFYLQLGIDAEKDIQANSKIKTVDITNKVLSLKKGNSWNYIDIDLSDVDRSFLLSNNDMRIVIIDNNSSQKKGTIYLGPYSFQKESIFTHASDDINIKTSSVNVGKDNYSSIISWENTNPSISENNIITAISYFSPASFENYKTINFTFAYKKDKEEITSSTEPTLSITLDSNASSPLAKGKEALKLNLYNIDSYITKDLTYHTVTINTKDNCVLIDGKEIDSNNAKIKVLNKDVVPSRVKYEINTTKYTSGSFYVNNITYKENEVEYTIQNALNASYKKNDILKIKDFNILSNGFIDLSSKQKFSDKNISVISNLKSGINITNISLNLDFALNNLDFTTVGHSVKTTSSFFNVLSLSEDYRWNKQDKSHNKENTASISLSRFKVPVTIKGSFTANNNSENINQNHNSSVSSSFNIGKTNIGFNSSMQTNQNINLQKNSNTLFDSSSYFDSYKNLSTFAFSLGSNEASSRKEIFSNSINLNILEGFVTPSISYSLIGNYENIKDANYEDKEVINLSLPFSFDNYKVSFTLNKIGGNTSHILMGGTYLTDLDLLFNNQKKRKGFYTSIPFYELFDSKMDQKIKGTYSAKYDISFSKSLYNSYKDLFVPSNVSVSLIRDIKNQDNYSDTYQVNAKIGTTSINNFGKLSKDELFSFFNQEEMNTGLSTLIKIPMDEKQNTQFNVNAYLQLILFFDNNSVLNNYFDFTIDNSLNWNTKGTFTYKRKGKTSLITAIISLFDKNFDISNYKIDRKDTFKYDLGVSSSRFKQTYDYLHSVDVGFLEHFTVTTGIGGTFTHIEDGAFGVNINYNLGGKISF